MAFCEGGDLSSLIEKRRMRYFPEHDVISWFIQIALALQYMHEEKILHRDLKTQNIFLTKNNMIKLGDFGIAKVLEGTMEMAKTVIGTPYYMSPELFRNQPYSYKSDIWSLGCVLYELISLRHAFDAREMKGLVQKILRGNYTPIPPSASKDCRDLVKKLLDLSPKSRPSVTEVLSMPFIRKQMGAYIKSQLGDEAAANIVQNDPKALNYHQIEQSRLEKQARKLGFDVQKRSEDPEVVKLPPPQKAKFDLKEPPKQSSLPSAADAERIQAEEKEKERQKRAKEFLDRELRAKERAEQALQRLQREKQERIKALQAQRELRQKRMQNMHPKGEAGNMNEWQHKLARAQVQHEERRREQGMRVPASRGPTPRGNGGQAMSVLEQRNRDARQRAARDKNNPQEQDKENVKQISVMPAQKQEEDSAAVRLKAMEGVKKAENAKLRDEMNRDMQQMEAKLAALKKKKEAEAVIKAKAQEDRRQRGMLVEENRKKEDEKRRKEEQDARDRDSAAMIYRNKPAAPPAPTRAASPPPHAQAPSRLVAPMDLAVPKSMAQENRQGGGHMLPASQYPQQQQQQSSHPTAGRYIEKPTNMAAMAGGQGMNPRPPQERVPIRYAQEGDKAGQAHSQQQVPRPAPQEGGFSRFARAPQMGKPPGLSMMPVDGDVRHSFPHTNNITPISMPNRLQVVPQADVYFTGADDSKPPFQTPSIPHILIVLLDRIVIASFPVLMVYSPYVCLAVLRDEGLSADLIMRQKELDRQRARQSVAYEHDRDIKEFDMNVHRINRAVGQSASSRPNIMVGEVGAKITERDRQLRQKQQRAQQQRMAEGAPSVRGYGDVAFQGGLYSPMKKKAAYFDGEDIVEDEDIFEAEEEVEAKAQEVNDEELLYYDREVAKIEHEVAQRTLKIQMLKTAVMTPVISDDEDDY